MKWFSGSIPEAVAEAKKNKKLFLVYVEGTDDMSKAMTSSYENAIISQKLSSDDIITLKLAANSVPYVQFCAIYPVLIIPSSYFIGINGAPIEVVTGNLGPTEFAEKIDKIIEIYKKSLPAKKEASVTQPSTSKASEPVLPPKENTASSSEQTASSSEQTASSSEQTASSSEQTASSSEQSASQPPNDSESKASLEERVERAKQLLELKKQLQECEEAEKERKLELERRTVGKALQKKQQEQKEKELQEFARSRAKEKEEERLAREKVKALIAQDRAERAARYQRIKEAENQVAEKTAKMKEDQERAARYAALNSNEARLQFRLPDGSSSSNIFSADSSLQEAREYVKNVVRPPFSHFSLCTTFPRRHFTQSDYSQTLRDLQLAPSAVLLILPEQSVSHISSNGGFWSSVIWTLLSPFLYTWRSITSLFSGLFRGRDEPSPQTSSESPKTQNESVRSQSAEGVRRRDGRFLRQDGNIYRLSNQSDDDGENNTWNGNSTQQM